MNQHLKNDLLYAWHTEYDGPPKLLIGVAVESYINTSWRTGMWHAIFSAPHYEINGFKPGKFLQEWPAGCTIEIRRADSISAENYADSTLIATLRQCVPQIARIEHLVPDSPIDSRIVVTRIEVDCIATWNSEI